MKLKWGLLFFTLLLFACRNKQQSRTSTPKVVVLASLDLYPKYPGCPDAYEKQAQLACLRQKFNAFIHYNINEQYRDTLLHLKDTIWLKFNIDTAGTTHFVHFIHDKDSMYNETAYRHIFQEIARRVPKMQPAVYHDQPVDFEFKLPVIVVTDTISPKN